MHTLFAAVMLEPEGDAKKKLGHRFCGAQKVMKRCHGMDTRSQVVSDIYIYTYLCIYIYTHHCNNL